MRHAEKNDTMEVRAITGTRVIMVAINVTEEARKGLLGFGIESGIEGGPKRWLKGTKYFPSVVPSPMEGAYYPTNEQPLQSFLWSQYTARPGTAYEISVVPFYGSPSHLDPGEKITFTISTEKEDDGKHAVYFNMGAIAGPAFKNTFGNKTLTPEMVNNVSDDGVLLDKEVAWLSRGLAEACLRYINDTKKGEGLRVCAYEFTYAPILDALKRALDRGVDVRIIYHKTKQNDDAVGTAHLPLTATVKGKKTTILFQRTRPPIPHNKFIVKLSGDQPTAIWTGSTNFTDTGFLGQTNVGHIVHDETVANTYLEYWTALSDNPTHNPALAKTVELTPNPPNNLPKGVTEFYSPRIADNMLDWYAQRIDDAGALTVMTIPFNVAPAILKGLMQKRASLRLVVLEDSPTDEVLAAEKANRGNLVFSNGALLNKTFIKHRSQFGGATVKPIENSQLDKWFVDEELPRKTNSGHVFFVHSKVLIVDPLSDDPLVCSGSANFSTGSLITNDENMLLIRGETRVADIYLTELDRIFRHFYARDVINRMAIEGSTDDPLQLKESDEWVADNFKVGSYKNTRRLVFFPSTPPAKWGDGAAKDTDPFKDEDVRAKAARAKKNSARKAGKVSTTSKPSAPKSRVKAGISVASTKKKPGSKKKKKKVTVSRKKKPVKKAVKKKTTRRKTRL